MRRIAAILDFLVGIVLLSIAILALGALPLELDNYRREPEDLWLLLALFALCVFLGSSAIIVGIALMRQRRVLNLSEKKLAGITIFAIAISLSLAGLGIASNNVISIELTLFAIPAAIFGCSLYFLKMMNLTS